MRVVVLGAAGQTGRHVVAGLVSAGHDVLGLVRSDVQAERLEHAGASASIADLTEVAPSELRSVFAEADAAVWAAGAGFGVDPETVDGDACIAAQRAADEAGVGRWVQISSMYADRPEQGPPFLQPVLRAKRRSDEAVQAGGLGWTIIRPGGLTNDSPIGQVDLGQHMTGGTIARADLAATAVLCVAEPGTARRDFDLVSGGTPIAEALASLDVQRAREDETRIEYL